MQPNSCYAWLACGGGAVGAIERNATNSKLEVQRPQGSVEEAAWQVCSSDSLGRRHWQEARVD